MRRLFFGVIVASGVALLGCVPAPESLSSGLVGCPDNEITVSRERWNYGTHSWVATCRGQRYFCNHAATGQYVSQVSCAPEVSAPETVTAERTPSQKAPSPPRTAVGFRLHSGLSEAKSSCESGGHAWAPEGDGFTCSGTPKNVGLPTTAWLRFCSDDTLCDLTAYAVFDPEADDADAKLKDLMAALRKQYGEPAKSRPTFEAGCRETLVRCVADGRAKWEAMWTWGSGEKIIAKTLSEEGVPELAVRYVVAEKFKGTSGVDGDAF